MTLLSVIHNELVTFYLQNVTATVKKLHFEFCKQGASFSLVHTESSEYCCIHCQRAVTFLL